MPHLKELHRKYKDQGLVLIGMHSDPDGEKMKVAVKENALEYVIGFDGDKSMFKSFALDSYPDYVIIDRKGVVRFVDLANSQVDRAVEMLLKEK